MAKDRKRKANNKMNQPSKKKKKTNNLIKDKIDIVNGKLNLLDKEEELLQGQLKEIQNRKRKLEDNEKDEIVHGKILKITNKENGKYFDNFNISNRERNVIVPTAQVRIELEDVFIGPYKALCDTGANPNLVSYEIANCLKELIMPTSRRLVGIDGKPFQIKRKAVLKIKPWYDSENYIEDIFWILPKGEQWNFTLPIRVLDYHKFKNVTNTPMADPYFWKPEQVHIVLGAGFFAKMIISVVGRTLDGTSILETEMGIVIFGTYAHEMEECVQLAMPAIEYNQTEQLDKLLERLWQADQIDDCSNMSIEEKEVEEHFVRTHFRDHTGRFVAQIPLIENLNDIGSSRQIALKRYMYNERKRMESLELNEIYVEKMREQITLGYMQLATESPNANEIVYYIPYHCIAKNNRIVYDASCKTDKGISLNDIQKLGAKLQMDLHWILSRMRRHRFVIYADIKRMFNQVCLARNQWNLQRIFWRENNREPLREYWLTVIIFGMKSSPFIAVRSVIQSAREKQELYPKAAKAIEEDFYMDDCATGANTESEAIQLAKEMDIILKGAGFELRQWKSNSKLVVQAMDSEMETSMLFPSGEEATILGLKWLMDSDQFTFVVKTPTIDGELTKRKIVSLVAQLYDPNGYVAPIVVKGKIIIQDLWRLGIDWDDVLPIEMERKCRDYWKDIINLERFTIDRWLGTGDGTKLQIHGFSDSGKPAFGAVLYVRAEHPNGTVTCNLLMSKARVAPLKTVSIPRLELNAAELLSRLLKSTLSRMEWSSIDYVLWMDSSVAYYWLRKVPRELKTYVANRVSSIQSNTNVNRWNHINGIDNPADLLTRGISSSELVNNKLWLHGPEWLVLPPSQWPKSSIMKEISNEVSEEIWKEIQGESNVFAVTDFNGFLRIGITGTKQNVPLLEYTGKLEKAINIICYAKRFIDIWLNKSKRKPKRRRTRKENVELQFTPPSLNEQAKAMEYLLIKTQQEYFNKELTALTNGQRLPERSNLEPLKPILDSNGLLRVGGRLDRANIDYEMKHPVIVPNGSRLAYLIIDYTHRKLKHAGIQAMTQNIRERYWIPKIRNELRNYVHKCVTCVRFNARMESQLMSELPAERVQAGKPFLYTGVDYAGPFEVKMVSGDDSDCRKKCWVAIFVCLRTRAVHIDIVTDMTGIAFIACYERFVARRGRCEKIFSDNGTPFVATSKELRKALESWLDRDMLEHLYSRGTEWNFMTPAAPHQGGIYEAAVKSMKFHLKRIVGMKVLPYEQLLTLLLQIEAILNSRPLHPLNDDPSDIQALTPGHFLIGEPLLLPLPFCIDPRPNTTGVRLWKDRQNMIKHFWQRWHSEYLTTLQERKKWRREKENVKVGQIVVLRSENFPPACWALGRIAEVLPSKDGLIRNVIVQTATNRLKRAVQKICILPVDESTESSKG